MRNVGIVGIGHIKFGKLEFELVDIMAWTALEAMKDAGIENGIDQVFVSNMGGGIINRQCGIASALVSNLNLEPAMAELVENGPASGSSAVKLGYMAIASGLANVVLVTGGETMRSLNGWQATDFVATLLHPEAEYNYGLTLPAFAGMFTRLYMEKYGLTEQHLAMISVKNHDNAALNPFAHVRLPVTLEAIYGNPDANVINPYMAEPLRIYDMCPVSDGAASLILCNMDIANRFRKKPIRIAGIGQATDTHCVHNRKDPLELTAVKGASEKAYKMAGIGPKEISFAELHDAFSILEVAESEEIGLFERGKAKNAIELGETRVTGRIPINSSGGLKAKGHPVGATGVSQIHELVKQLRREAEPGRQVKEPNYGLAINFGGHAEEN
ncbi:acetyl-CoA acetyltransferase [bacterium]|nr:acetyl-CoA acetyltransferase [bacterium]